MLHGAGTVLLTGHSYPAPLRHTTPGVCVSNSCRIQSYQGLPSGLSGSGLQVNQGHLASSSSDIPSAIGGQNFFHGCSLSSSRTSPLWIGDVGLLIASSSVPLLMRTLASNGSYDRLPDKGRSLQWGSVDCQCISVKDLVRMALYMFRTVPLCPKAPNRAVMQG